MAKGNWYYINSETLNQQIAIDQNTGWLFCKDGVKYSPEETRRLLRTGKEIPLQVHLLKKEFGGELVSAPVEPSLRYKNFEFGR